MSQHLQNDIQHLNSLILDMGGRAEEALRKAVTSLIDRNEVLAAEVRAEDDRLDQLENEIEDACLKDLALHQPVASDLRYIVAVLKINNDLERIGDLASGIAKRAQLAAQQPEMEFPEQLGEMAERVRHALATSLNALVNRDLGPVEEIIATDKKVDKLDKQLYAYVQDQLKAGSPHVNVLLHILTVSRALERVGDLTVNIAEDVHYLITGNVIRHL